MQLTTNRDASTQVGSNSRRRLESWKVIASALGCDVKTAQRWEKQRGLPVYRIPGGGRGSIFAYDDELETWRHSAEVVPAESSADNEPVSPPKLHRRTFLRLAVGVGAAGLAAITVKNIFWRQTPNAESLALDGQLLTARDAHGLPCWEYRIARPLRELSERDRKRRLQLVDWQQDGRNSAVFIGSHLLGGAQATCAEEVLYRFTPAGEPLEPIKLAADLKDHTGQPFEPGWLATDVLLTGSDRRPPRLWIALGHYLRYASAVLSVNASGAQLTRFANAGEVQALCELTNGQDHLIAAAGINNAVDRTCLAVFGQNDPPATSPPVGSPLYVYQNNPAGHVRAYAILPPSEYNRLLAAPYSHVLDLYAAGGRVVVTLALGAGAGTHYTVEFSSDLTPLKALHRGSEPLQHAEMEAKKLVTHSYTHCPERLTPMPIRRWTPEQQWEELSAPWVSQGNPG